MTTTRASRLGHPYHSLDGRLWPEADDRIITAPVMALYEGCCRLVVIQRAAAGWYGPPGKAVGAPSGVWQEKPATNPKARGTWKFRPAMIWRLRRMGRYSDPTFDPNSISIPIFGCDPAETAARCFAARTPAPAAPSAFDAFIGSLAAAVAGHLQPLRIAGGAGVIPFPRSAQEG